MKSINGRHVNTGLSQRAIQNHLTGQLEIIVALNDIHDQGPLSVESEDSRMDRCHGAQEACDFVRGGDFPPSAIAFDAQFDK